MVKLISKEEVDRLLTDYFKNVINDESDNITITREVGDYYAIIIVHSEKGNFNGRKDFALSRLTVREILNVYYQKEGLRIPSSENHIVDGEFIGIMADVVPINDKNNKPKTRTLVENKTFKK